MRGSTSVGYDQFETSPEAFEQELRPAVYERRPTDRLKANYSIDITKLQMRFLHYAFLSKKSCFGTNFLAAIFWPN